MADMTFGVKVNEELKKKLTKLIKESGLQGKDFMQNLVNMYEMENTKNSTPEIAQDIVELQYLTSRINGIYINLSHRIDNIKNSNNEAYEKELKDREEKILSLESDLKNAKDTNNKLIKELNQIKLSNEEMANKISGLEDTNNSNKLLIKEYNQKLYDFSQKLNEFKQLTADTTTYKKQIETLSKDNESLKVALEKGNFKLNQEIMEKNNEISSLEKNIKLINEEKRREIDTLKDKLHIEKEKSLLELEKDCQMKVNSTIEQCNLKIKSLLERLENIKDINEKTNSNI